MSAAPLSVEQALRISHCSNTGKEHACIGTCIITKDGITLNCTLCGEDRQPAYDPNEHLQERARSILRVAGLDFENLADMIKTAVLREISRDYCQNCQHPVFLDKKYLDYFNCSCGWNWYRHTGWKAPKEL